MKTGPGRPPVTDVDRALGAKIRERRVSIGITQQQLADLIGVTNQQAHKYETGTNRLSASRLFRIAEALGVKVGYFFPDEDAQPSARTTVHDRSVVELARNFLAIDDPRQRQLVSDLARTLAGNVAAKDTDQDEA